MIGFSKRLTIIALCILFSSTAHADNMSGQSMNLILLLFVVACLLWVWEFFVWPVFVPRDKGNKFIVSMKVLRYIFSTICIGIGGLIVFLSYSMNFWLLIIAAPYFLATYLFIAPLMGRYTIPENWSEQKIAILFLISSIIAAILFAIYYITAAISFLNSWGFLAIALGIKLNAKEERGYSEMINKILKILEIMVIIFIIGIVVAYFIFSTMYS